MNDQSSSSLAAVPSRARLGLTLGALSAIGPLGIDLYLPAFPTMAAELATTPGEIQRTLSVFFLALAAAQIPIGTLSDRLGRKAALYLGLTLFIAASLACVFAQSVGALQFMRFVQGFGVCAGTVVSRAMIRDLATGHEAARLMALSFLVIGISPVLAPLAGSLLLSLMPWRGLFLLLALAGLMDMVLVRFELQESLPIPRRVPRGTPLLPILRGLMMNPRFITAGLVAGLSMTVPYAYLTAAPFVFTHSLGLNTHQYTLLLGVDALCSITAIQFSPTLMQRWGARTLIARASLIGGVLTAVLVIAALSNHLGLILFQLISMWLFSLVGLMLTPAAVTALDAARSGAGAAASVLGTLQLAVTALASGIISLLPSFSVLPLLAVLGGSFILIRVLMTVLHSGTQTGTPLHESGR